MKRYTAAQILAHPRTSSYRMRSPVGVLVHDTVTPLGGSSWWTRKRVIELVANGVNQGTKKNPHWIPGPLYHYLVRDNGEVIQVCDLRWKTNNAGRGCGSRLKLLQGGRSPFTVELGPDSTNGNPYLWGVALARKGVKPAPPKMLDALHDVVKHLYDRAGWDASETWRVLGHRDWTRRKVDPGRVNIREFMGADPEIRPP